MNDGFGFANAGWGREWRKIHVTGTRFNEKEKHSHVTRRQKLRILYQLLVLFETTTRLTLSTYVIHMNGTSDECGCI